MARGDEPACPVVACLVAFDQLADLDSPRR
jgi:hypothetical protein